MLSPSLRILNFDDSLTKQKHLVERYCPEIIDLTGIGPACRLWVNSKNTKKIKSVLLPESRQCPTFIGSGDFHHVSSLLIEQFREPVTVIVFDFHPDWDILPPRLGCGSWVTRTLTQQNVKKVLLLGVSSGDISRISIHTGNVQALKNNRLELYPYEHTPTTKVLRNVPENASLQARRRGLFTSIYWEELKNKNLSDFMLTTIKRLETRQVYVSIDKDCLRAEHALTNWEEGCFSLNELLRMLKLIKENLDIVGIDIAGDYSLPKPAGRLKSLCSRLDHPAVFSAKDKPESLICTTNEQTNIKLAEALKR
ncbi:MAG: arginase family protein [Pseudomonadota bacterium]